MSEFDSPAQILANLSQMSRDSLDTAHKLGGAYNCREVTELDREVYHTVITANHGILGPVRVQLTCGVQKPITTSDWYSVCPKPFVGEVIIPERKLSFFSLALRPQPIESLYPQLFVNPVIFVASVHHNSLNEPGVAVSSFWEALDSRSGQKVAGSLQELSLSSAGIFFPEDRESIDTFIEFSQKTEKWGITGTLRRIHSRFTRMKVAPLTQYDLLAGTKSKVTYSSLPKEVAEAAA